MDDVHSPGIVLVSHSAAIAEGLALMAREVAGDGVQVVPAGGGPEGTLGTDGGRIADAIVEADSGAGVVLLADIGSAVLSIRAVLADGMADGVQAVLADAPLVEGAIAAAVTAATGGTIDAVRSAAEEAWDVRKL
jgi:phosphoenolpyruvate---glycerone phosphotransferase subunit DhaM